jgi:hypothetical protein
MFQRLPRLGLAIGVACDALLVRMTAVPAVLALAGRHAWYLPRWLGRLLPGLDSEGACIQQQPGPAQAQVAGYPATCCGLRGQAAAWCRTLSLPRS